MLRRRSYTAVAIASVALVVAGTATSSANSRPGSGKVGPYAFFVKLHPNAPHTSAAQRRGESESDGSSEVQQRAAFEQSIIAAPAEEAPAAGLLAAHRAAQSLPMRSGRWQEVTGKPFIDDPIKRGQDYGTGHGYVTGRLTALTHSGNMVYAASASGGIWRSHDFGATWRPVNAGLPRLAVGALATLGDGSVWAGTGEANNAAENQYGVGVFRLARGASTWRRVGGSELFGAGIFRIKRLRGYIYAATSLGLYRRAVGAPASAHWRPVLQPAGRQAYPPSSEVTDIIAVPGTQRRRILAVIGWSGYSDPPATTYNGFWVGNGAPGSFRRITPTGDIHPKTIGRTSFTGSHGWLYAVVENTATLDLRGQGVYVDKSGNPRGPWKRIASVDKLAASGSALGNSHSSYYPGVQADYNQYVLADPRNRRHIYLGLEEVYESTNGGSTWRTVGPYWNLSVLGVLSCNPTNRTPYECPPTPHSDQHAAMIFGRQFWTGNDGGAWRRPLILHTRGGWTNLNPTLHVTQNYSIATGKVGRVLAYWGGLQDNGESYTRDNMVTVAQAFTGDGGDTIVAPLHGNRAVVEYTNLDMWLTTDGGVNTYREISPSCVTATNPPKHCDPNPRFVAPITMDVNNTRHWVAGGQYVWNDTAGWRTVCNGSDGCDWKSVYNTGDGHQISALAVNGRTIYAAWCGLCNPEGFTRGLATNYGGKWHELALNGIPNRYITSLAVDPANPAHVYMTVGSYSRRWIPNAGYGHVFETRNGGRTWKDISGNLPDAPVYAVAIARGQLVVGTEVGAFITSRGRAEGHWSQLGRGLPNVTVWDLTVRFGWVVAGTHGRGDWRMKLF